LAVFAEACAVLLLAALAGVLIVTTLLGHLFFEHLWLQLMTLLPFAMLGYFLFMRIVIGYLRPFYGDCIKSPTEAPA